MAEWRARSVDPGGLDLPALVAGLTTVLLWGSAFVGIRAAGHSLSPGSIALGRLLVASAILSGVALLRREKLPAPRAFGPIAVFGLLFLGAYSITLNVAERHVDAGTSAMIVNTGPLLIALLAGIALREGFPRGLLLGCAVALVGCVVIGAAALAHSPGPHTSGRCRPPLASQPGRSPSAAQARGVRRRSTTSPRSPRSSSPGRISERGRPRSRSVAARCA